MVSHFSGKTFRVKVDDVGDEIRSHENLQCLLKVYIPNSINYIEFADKVSKGCTYDTVTGHTLWRVISFLTTEEIIPRRNKKIPRTDETYIRYTENKKAIYEG